MKRKIKLVFFDYGDILVPSPGSDFCAFAEHFRKSRGINPKEHDHAWKKLKARVLIGKIKFATTQERVFKSLGKTNKDARDWMRHCKRYHLSNKPYPGVVETLKKLKLAGFKTAVLSDTVHSGAFKKSTIKSWGATVDAVYCSCGLGCKKPNARAYRAVLHRFKVKPREAVFVGHAKDELDGAHRLGIHTIAFKPDKNAHGDFKTNSFKKILKIISSQIDR